MKTETFLNHGGYALIAWGVVFQAWIEYHFIWPLVARWLAPHSFTIYAVTGHVMHWN